MSKFDWRLALSALSLFTLGNVILVSVARDTVIDQLLFGLLAASLFFLFSRIDYRIFKSLATTLYLVSLLLLILTFFLGASSRGATRWLAIGPWQIQTSEIIKPLMILTFASWFSHIKSWNLVNLTGSVLAIAIPFGFIFKQPDLGSGLIMSLSWLGQLFAAGFPIFLIIISSLSLSVLSPLLWHLLQDYQRRRLLTFINPQSDPLLAGYNAIQAVITVGSGQLWGRGLGHGTQSHLRFLPERHTDFIFASLTEELGFVGSLLVISLFTLLLWRILVATRHAPDRFGYLICLGVFSSLFCQMFINIGMNVGLLPITGVTLPLLSSGGSSLIATAISLGLVINIASQARSPRPLQIH